MTSSSAGNVLNQRLLMVTFAQLLRFLPAHDIKSKKDTYI